VGKKKKPKLASEDWGVAKALAGKLAWDKGRPGSLALLSSCAVGFIFGNGKKRKSMLVSVEGWKKKNKGGTPARNR